MERFDGNPQNDGQDLASPGLNQPETTYQPFDEIASGRIADYVDKLFTDGAPKSFIDTGRTTAERALEPLGWSFSEILALYTAGHSQEDIEEMVIKRGRPLRNTPISRKEHYERTAILLDEPLPIPINGFQTTSIRMAEKAEGTVTIEKDDRSPSGFALKGSILESGEAFLHQGANEVGRGSEFKTFDMFKHISRLHLSIIINETTITISPESKVNKTYLV